MPAVIDWSSLLWPWSSNPKTLSSHKANQQAPGARDGASIQQASDLSNWFHQRLGFLTGDAPIDPWILAATFVAILLGSYWTLLILRRLFEQPTNTHQQTPSSTGSINTDQRITLLQDGMSRRLNEIEDHSKKLIAEQVDAIQKRFQQELDDKVKAIEANVQRALSQRLEDIDDDVRRRVKQSVEVLEDGLRTKLNKEAFDSIYREMSQRIEALEEGVRIMDGKQLDVEASTIVQRALGQRLGSVEETLKIIEGKTRSSSQRLDAVDDSVRVIDSRTKAMSQRLEAVEDNMGSIDAQTTLLSHDINRGEQAIEKVQRQIRTLPDNEKMREFSDGWEFKFRQIEVKVEELEELEGQRTKLLEDAKSSPTLTWSRLDTQEIEPSGPLYANLPLDGSPDSSYAYTSDGSYLPPTPSPSDRSSDRSSSRGSRTHSFYGHASTPTPTSASKRRRLEAAGFTDTTFASRQRLFHSRTTSTI